MPRFTTYFICYSRHDWLLDHSEPRTLNFCICFQGHNSQDLFNKVICKHQNDQDQVARYRPVFIWYPAKFNEMLSESFRCPFLCLMSAALKQTDDQSESVCLIKVSIICMIIHMGLLICFRYLYKVLIEETRATVGVWPQATIRDR